MSDADIVLRTPRLLLRKLAAYDLTFLQTLYGDPEIMRFISGKPRTLEETKTRLERNLEQHRTFGFGLYIATLRESDRAVGRCGLEPVVTSDGLEGDLAWMFRKEYWGRGLATEIGSVLIDFGKEHLGLKRVFATAHFQNVASIRVMQKLGMRLARKSQDRVEYEATTGVAGPPTGRAA